MRHLGLISILVVLAAGCSASGEGADSLLGPGLSRPGADELVDELDPALDGGGYGILLFDTTSSMNTVRSSTGHTRCEDAKTMAKAYVTDFFNPFKIDGDGLAIWGFTNNPYASDDVQPTITGYYTDSLSAKTAINGLTCAGSSPLADALCKGVNGDGETFTIDPMLDMMFVVTDGVEDNSDGECSGVSGSINTPGTWQYKVLAEMIATGIRVDTRYWIDPTFLANPDSIDSFAAEDEPSDPTLEELELVADVEDLPQAKLDELVAAHHAAGAGTGTGVKPACGTMCQELGLFAAMAAESGGTWGAVKDNDAQYPVQDTVDPVTGPVHPTQAPPAAEAPVEAGS